MMTIPFMITIIVTASVLWWIYLSWEIHSSVSDFWMRYFFIDFWKDYMKEKGVFLGLLFYFFVGISIFFVASVGFFLVLEFFTYLATIFKINSVLTTIRVIVFYILTLPLVVWLGYSTLVELEKERKKQT